MQVGLPVTAVRTGGVLPEVGGAADISLNHIFASLFPFIGLQIIGLLIVLFIPDVAMFLPRLLH